MPDGRMTATPEECDEFYAAFANQISTDLFRRLAKIKVRLADDEEAGIEHMSELAAKLVVLWWHLVLINGLSSDDKREFIELSNDLQLGLRWLGKKAAAGSDLVGIAHAANETVDRLLDQLPPGKLPPKAPRLSVVPRPLMVH